MSVSGSSNTVLVACLEEFRKLKGMAEKAFVQLDDADFHVRINPHQNAIAAIVKHMAGNMRSRWTDFLTTDGEKPDRNREDEFVDDLPSREAIMQRWEEGWRCVFNALEPLSDADLGRTVLIRREPHTVMQAITRQLSHYAAHVGQILLIGKHLKGDAWQYLSIPPGGTEAFNRRMGM